jgi:hydrogenase-4 component F
MSGDTLARLVLALPLAAAGLVWLPWLATRHRPEPRRDQTSSGERAQDIITVGSSALSMVVVVVLAAHVLTGNGRQVRTTVLVDLHVDALSVYVLLLVSLVTLVASCYVGPYWRRRRRGGAAIRTGFYCLFSLFSFSMVLVPMVADLVILWIGIVFTTVTSTGLLGIERAERPSPRRLEAAWKYILITSAGIIFALLGTLFLADAVPGGRASALSVKWPDLVAIAPDLNPSVVRLSFVFVLIGYGAKAGLAPMHTWLPDAHGEAPYPVSALLSGVLLKTALYVVLRFVTITNGTRGGVTFTSTVLLVVGLLSLATAVPMILKANGFKRILAYHSLEHMGIITIGIGIGGPIATFGALLHVLNHGVTKSLMFLAYGNVQDNYRDLSETDPDRAAELAPVTSSIEGSSQTDLVRGADRPTHSDAAGELPSGIDGSRSEKMVGVLRAMPVTGSMLAFGGLALVGSPPFSIFLSELLILWGGTRRLIDSPSVWIALVIALFIASIAFIFAGLVRHLGWMLLGEPPTGHRPERPRQYLPLLVLFAIVLLLGVLIPSTPVFDLRGIIDASVAIVCENGCPQ